MPNFKYRAKNFDGKEVSSVMEAIDARELGEKLKKEGFILLEVGAADSAVTSNEGSNSVKKLAQKLAAIEFFATVKIEEKMIFSRNLAVMIKAGLPVARALTALAHETKNPYFERVISDVVEHVKKGDTLKDSFSNHPKVFSPLFIAMIEAGEESGKLAEGLNILASQMKKDHDLVRRIKGAMFYPAIILTVMIAIGVLMMIYVVPTLLSTFDEIGVDLPAATQVIVSLSDFLRGNILGILIALPIIIFGMRKGVSTTRGKHMLDAITLYSPIVGPIAQQFNTARTARSLASLMSSGVQITSALDITSRILQNHYYSDILKVAGEEIQKGNKMSDVFAKNERLYSSLLAEMMAVGEETGNTSAMLEEVAVFYEGEIETTTKNLSTIIEPILMVVIGIFVGFFAFAMIQPLYGVVDAI